VPPSFAPSSATELLHSLIVDIVLLIAILNIPPYILSVLLLGTVLLISRRSRRRKPFSNPASTGPTTATTRLVPSWPTAFTYCQQHPVRVICSGSSEMPAPKSPDLEPSKQKAAERVYCTYCGKGFSRKEHLERHLPTREQPTVMKLYIGTDASRQPRYQRQATLL
jgi:hypothetical protein